MGTRRFGNSIQKRLRHRKNASRNKTAVVRDYQIINMKEEEVKIPANKFGGVEGVLTKKTSRKIKNNHA